MEVPFIAATALTHNVCMENTHLSPTPLTLVGLALLAGGGLEASGALPLEVALSSVFRNLYMYMIYKKQFCMCLESAEPCTA